MGVCGCGGGGARGHRRHTSLIYKEVCGEFPCGCFVLFGVNSIKATDAIHYHNSLQCKHDSNTERSQLWYARRCCSECRRFFLRIERGM